MKQLLIGTFAVLGTSVCAAATPAATLLFAQEGTQIVDASGLARTAKKGDLVHSGERVRTAAGVISQMQLPDGSLIGVRPGSELRLNAPEGPNPAPIVTLIQGAARLIGAELMDIKKPSNITFQSGVATLRLQGADLESAVVHADKGANPTPGAPGSAPGSYQRLLVGTGSIGAGTQLKPLEPRQVNFVGPTAAAPMVVATAMPALTLGTRVTTASLGEAVIGSKSALPAPSGPAPLPTGGTLTAIAPVAPVAPIGSLTTTAQLQPAPLATAPAIAPVLTAPLLTAPIITTVFAPTAPIIVATTVLPPPPIVIQPIVTYTAPILTQPIVTKPPVCTRLISGKCV